MHSWRTFAGLLSWVILLTTLSGCGNSLLSLDSTTNDQVGKERSGYDLIIPKSGIYEVCSSDLPGNRPAGMADFAILRGEQTLSSWIVKTPEGNCLQFFVDFLENRFSNQVSLKLVPVDNGSARISVEDGRDEVEGQGRIYTPQAYSDFEENLIYEPIYEHDLPWLWQRAAPTKPVQIRILAPAFQPAPEAVEIYFWTKTTGAVGQDGITSEHAVDLVVTDGDQERITWSGNGVKVIRLPVNLGESWDGSVEIKFGVAPSEFPKWDEIYLDKVRLIYSAAKVPNQDGLLGVQDGLVDASSWGEALLVATKNGFVSSVQRSYLTKRYLFTFSDFEYRRYLVDQIQKPAEILLIQTESSLLKTLEDVDYLAIGPEIWHEHTQPLLDLREAQGLRSAYLDLEDVYRLFGDGTRNPQAVRKLLRYVKTHLSTQLSYVVLIGDFSHELSQGINDAGEMPTSFVYSLQGGWTASDASLADLDQDGLPDLAVGRIPVSRVEELKQTIQKIVRYEDELENSNQNMRIGILPDPAETFFLSTATELSQFFASQFKDADHEVVLRNQNLMDWLSEADSSETNIVMYLGHGSLQQLSVSNLLSTKDIARENPGDAKSGILMFTCLSGYFVHPEVDALAETLLKDPESGFVAVYGPTSLTLTTDQAPIMELIANRLASGQSQRYADLINFQGIKFEKISPGLYDVIATMVFFGDPATSLP
jgi:hypothetical protein